MTVEKDRINEPHRSRAAGSEEYEVRHFAEAIGLDVEKVRKLIQRHGQEGATPDSEARKPGRH